MSGVVLAADGKPAPGAQVIIEALPNQSISEDDQNKPVTDEAGQFAFTALEGFEYRLHAFHEEMSMTSSITDFSLKQGVQFITLVLLNRTRLPILTRPK